MMTTEPARKSTSLLKLAVFVFFLSLYLLTITPDIGSPDYLSMFRVSQSLVEEGSISLLNQSLKDPREFIVRVSKYPLLPSLVGVPFYALGKWGGRIMGRPLDNSELLLAASVSAPVFGALTCLLLFHFILAMGLGVRTALLSVCCFGLSTSAWPHSLWIGTEPVTMFAILSAVYAAYRYKTHGRYIWLYLSGFFSGASISARELSLLLVVPPVLVYVLVAGWKEVEGAPWRSQLHAGLRSLSIFAMGFIPFLLLNVWYNFARYGLLSNTAYLGHGGKISDLFHNPLLIGLYGYFLSPGQSLFLWCPILVLLFFSISTFYAQYKAEFILCFSISLLHLFVYSKYYYWFGGVSFGPRFFVPVLPLLTLSLSFFFETLPARRAWIKVLALLLFCGGVAIQTAWFWGEPSSDWKVKYGMNDWSFESDVASEEVVQYFPQSFPLLWGRKSVKEVLAQLSFTPYNIRSLRLPVLLILLGTLSGAGVHLVRAMKLTPSGNSLWSLKARTATRVRALTSNFPSYKPAAMGALGLLCLALAFYTAFKYAYVPLTRFNSKPLGEIEYPIGDGDIVNAPVLCGKINVDAWAVDRHGIRALAVYIDDVKVAEAQYERGEPSTDIYDLYPYIPNSDYARYQVVGIDTTRFSNGLHNLLVKAVNRKGRWADLDGGPVFLQNERPYNFWAHLAEATADGNNMAQDRILSINQKPRRVLLQRSNSSIIFAKIPIYENAVLRLGVGLAGPEAAQDDLSRALEVTTDSGEALFALTVNPEEHAENPQWVEEQIDLSSFANQVITLTFSVKTISGWDPEEDRATVIAWSDLAIVYPAPATEH